MEDLTNQHQHQAMKVSDWVITILITAIPLVGLIMLFVWAFGSETNVNKVNWAKAILIWYAILLALNLLILILFGAVIFSSMNY